MTEIHGHCEDRFNDLRTLLRNNIDTNNELGASIAVQIDGKTVVDLWAGHQDAEKTLPWHQDTIVNVWSTSKLTGSFAILILADRGLVYLDDPVCKYWPAFGVNGKEAVRVRDIISHTSGVAAWDEPITLEEIYNVPASTARLASQKPWWTPGTAMGYHSLTHGHLISELIRCVTGKSLSQFLREEATSVLDADFQYGVVEKDYGRTATMIGPPKSEGDFVMPVPEPGSVKERFANAPPSLDAAVVANSVAWRGAEVASGNGHSNARALTRLLSPLVLGGVGWNGKRVLQSTKMIDEIFKTMAYGDEVCVGLRFRFGTGFGLPEKDTYFDWVPWSTHDEGAVDGKGERICGWGGWGGSMGIIDVGRRMVIGYAMNQMHNVGMGSKCTKEYVKEIYSVLGVEVQGET